MANWPKWLRITFIVSGCLFALAVMFSVYVLVSHTVIPALSVETPPQPGNPQQPPVEPTNLVNYITAITGLVTAVSGLYGQILAGRKQELEYQLAKEQLKKKAEETAPKEEEPKEAAPRKSERHRKKE